MNNELSGKLPGELGNLTALTKLLVSRNSLEGEIPISVAASPSLSIFNLSENLFSGRVPKALYNNLNLQVVNVGVNRFSGDVTADLEEMSKLPNIWGIQMNANQFTGSLPPSIGNLSSLQYLDLSFNNLDGIIPESIANCSSLQYLVLSSNKLTGSIPRTVGQCSNLEFVNLAQNYLSGDIPAEIGNCTKLRVLHLGGNKFKGKLKVDFSRVTSSNLILGISNNSFIGDINFFESIATNPNFTIVSACLNNLTGTIPTNYDVKRLSKLQVLMLGYNKLEGKVPEWMWELPSLQVLDLSNNKLSGPVTSSSNFTLLNGFIHKNVKTVPYNCHKLDSYCAYGFDFYLNDRKFEVSMSYLTYFKYLDISCNQFSGIIPPSIGKLTNLSYLNLSNNAFTGVIPAAMGRIFNLQSFDVSHNLLTGPIPQEFAGLSQLADLKMGNNSLSGPIPRSIQLQSFSVDSFLPGNDELCNEPLARLCIVSKNDSTTTADPVNFNSDSIENFISVLGFVVGFVALAIAIFVRHYQNHPKKKVVPADSSLTRNYDRYGAFKLPE
ncbi:uncharacterized protein [Physcomitrium patens]|uniref:Disease resistance R13L4/SHOC-2-like LRR domain-containing protein n=1 Tax=Physcomitrium patens TaxID=3218 RepID=A0A2K1L6D9_PHYPA|nr:hypothetical protein PHYPA_000005 [Physcomitrium patens]